jgi:hypothetical protein
MLIRLGCKTRMPAPKYRARGTNPDATVNEAQWNELRLRAANEKDPFKLAVTLSKMAALAAAEQKQVVQRLSGALRNYKAYKSSGSTGWTKPDPAEFSDPVPPPGYTPTDSPESISRFLRLAATALDHKSRASGGAS